jgi:GMP synthase (glutamine-hydrolysing)
MEKILIIKTGSTLAVLKVLKGDFEHWVLSGMGTDSGEMLTVDVTAGAPLPAYEALRGVVVTGSHSMVTEHLDWSERTAQWLRGAVAQKIPTLGICYGHQLLAYALGGEVGDNPGGCEYGTVEVSLSEAAGQDPLLGGLPARLQVHMCHTQSVLRLPEGAVRLATGERDDNAAFRVGECAWGVQFHPEFDADVVRAYIQHMHLLLRAEGQDPEALKAGTVDTPYGSKILGRFSKCSGR